MFQVPQKTRSAAWPKPSDIIRSEQAVAETVPCLGMLLLIPLQVFPKVLAECVLLIDAGLRVHLEDIGVMHEVWEQHQEKMLTLLSWQQQLLELLIVCGKWN
mgnify:CR=1 FL=1